MAWPPNGVKPLAIIPTYVTTGNDVEMVSTTMRTLRETVGDEVDLFVVDDGSPEEELRKATRLHTESFGGAYHDKGRNEGFSHTVNIGLRQALREGRDAILVNADIEFTDKGWLRFMSRQQTSDGMNLASIVGALLLYPNGTIQHGGVFFSLLYREWDHLFRHGPADLPEAKHARLCPVTGALQYIRHECLEGIGVYDESFRMGWEDVDYCVRAWQSGRECIVQPAAQAVHHESAFRGRPTPKIARWTEESWLTFVEKHRGTSFAMFSPSLVVEESD